MTPGYYHCNKKFSEIPQQFPERLEQGACRDQEAVRPEIKKSEINLKTIKSPCLKRVDLLLASSE